MNPRFLSQKIKYDGTQITSLWAFRKAGLIGDSIVSFIGPCDIKPKNIVDLEDLQSGAKIYSRLMLHFIIEFFDLDLTKAVLYQRILASIIKDSLIKKTNRSFTRRGDDVFYGKYKVTISIATLTSVSSKVHFGINIESKGTPVNTKGLKDYKINPRKFAQEIMLSFIREVSDVAKCRSKVRGVE